MTEDRKVNLRGVLCFSFESYSRNSRGVYIKTPTIKIIHVVEEESKNKAHLLLKTSAKVCLLNISKRREIKPVNPKGNQPWILIGKTDAEAEALILWLSDTNSWLNWKDPEDGKDWRPRRWRQQRMIWLDSITDSIDMHFSKLRKIVEDRGAWHAIQSMGSKELDVT